MSRSSPLAAPPARATSATAPLTLDYHALHGIAEALGFHREAALVNRRLETLDLPFGVYVMGRPGAGKSTVVDLLLDRTMAGATPAVPWLHVYRATPHRYEYAEIYRTDTDQGVQRLPIPRVQAWITELATREGALQRAGVERIVWYVQTTGLPEHVALTEVPTDGHGRIPMQHCWEADAILWALRGDRLTDALTRQALTAFKAQHNPAAPSLGVVTHMDRRPEAEWLEALDQVRRSLAPHLDHVVPMALAKDGATGLPGDTIAPLKRAVRHRFFRGAHLARHHTHSQFIDAMRETVATRFEGYVDGVLTDRWEALRFEQAVEQGFAEAQAASLDQTDAFLEALREDLLQRPPHAPSPLDDTLPIKTQVFLQRLREDLEYATLSLWDQSAWDTPNATLSSDIAVAASQVPPPRQWLQAVRRPPSAPPAPPRRGLRLFQDRLRRSEPTPATEVDLWQPAATWLRTVLDQARTQVSTWLEALTDHLRALLLQRARTAFAQRHGFGPMEVADALHDREQQFLRWRHGRLLSVAVPHTTGPPLSPIAFLCEMQHEAFITTWNRSLLKQSYHDTVKRIRVHVGAEVESARQRVQAAWQEQRSALDAHLTTMQQQRATPLGLLRATTWTLREILASMDPPLPDPAEHLRLRWHRLLPTSPRRSRSLFLDTHGETFLQPLPSTSTAGTPHALQRLLSDRLHRAVQQTGALRSGPDHHEAQATILVAPQGRPAILGSTLLLGSLGVGLLGGWLYLFGTGVISLLLLGTLIAAGGWRGRGLVQRLYQRHRPQHLAAERALLLDQLQAHLHQHVDRVQHHVERLLTHPDVFADVEYAFLARQTPPTALYLPFATLTQRLRTGS
ncbi:MAG: hypothetical protein AAGI71_12755 [Bacteroidota bacterium]